MKRTLLTLVGKTIIALNSILWKLPGNLALKLNQKIKWFVIGFNRKHELNLWD